MSTAGDFKPVDLRFEQMDVDGVPGLVYHVVPSPDDDSPEDNVGFQLATLASRLLDDEINRIGTLTVEAPGDASTEVLEETVRRELKKRGVS